MPIDRFELRDGRLEWVDLAATYGLSTALEIRILWAAFDNEHETSEPIPGERSARLPAMQDDGYWQAVLDSPVRPGQTVRVYIRKHGDQSRIVGVERTW